MSLRCPERAQQRCHLTAGASIQKTVQGELGSAKRDPASQAEKLAGVRELVGYSRSGFAEHGGERLNVGEAAAFAAVDQRLVAVFAAQAVGETLDHRSGGRADVDLGRGRRQ